MPKTKARKKGHVIGGRSSAPTTLPQNAVNAGRGQVAQRTVAPNALNYQTLIMPAMVMLGCWGLAVSFAFFTTEPNRFLYAGMAVVMGLMWAVSLGIRLRRLMQKS